MICSNDDLLKYQTCNNTHHRHQNNHHHHHHHLFFDIFVTVSSQDSEASQPVASMGLRLSTTNVPVAAVSDFNEIRENLGIGRDQNGATSLALSMLLLLF